jgi:predicted GNAT family N-acyltransferase
MVDAADFVPLRTFGPKQVEEVHSLYFNEWWANRRTLDETRRVVANSTMNFGIVRRSTGELVSYARVLSDLTFKAVIFDVIVRPDHRGHRLGAKIMDDIISEPRLAAVSHFELYCLPDMEPFYARWGFSSDVGSVRLMRRVTT